MSTYLRIVDATETHQIGWKDICYNSILTTRERHIDVAKNFTKEDLECKSSFLRWYNQELIYPCRVQVIKKISYKNGNVTKNVIYENIIYRNGTTSEKLRIDKLRKTIENYRNDPVKFAKDYLGIELHPFEKLILELNIIGNKLGKLIK